MTTPNINASRIIAVLVERLGGPQQITMQELDRYETNYPANLTHNPGDDILTVSVMTKTKESG